MSRRKQPTDQETIEAVFLRLDGPAAIAAFASARSILIGRGLVAIAPDGSQRKQRADKGVPRARKLGTTSAEIDSRQERLAIGDKHQ